MSDLTQYMIERKPTQTEARFCGRLAGVQATHLLKEAHVWKQVFRIDHD